MYPRLGDKKVESAQSVAEQAKLGGYREELAKLNDKYEKAFPGLRYVVFVNGCGRPEIMDDMRPWIAGSNFTKEVDSAFQVSLQYFILPDFCYLIYFFSY